MRYSEWKTAECNAELAGKLADEQNLPLPVASVLARRGIADKNAAEQFLNPRLSNLSDPSLIPGVNRAVDVIIDAVLKKRKIVVYGDYDVDGLTSTALMLRVLGKAGAGAGFFLPNRIEDGYGLTIDCLQRCIEEQRPDLIITVDCGTNSYEAVDFVKQKGVDIVISDHHEPSGRTAAALAVVNPKLGGKPEVLDLSGVGVAFKLCHALIKKGLGGKPGAIDLRDWLDVVALGTVADIVPLVHENRIIVRHGLKKLEKTSLEGLRALIEVSRAGRNMDTYQVGFVLGPRLNAAGRLGNAETALELLLTDDRSAALTLAQKLEKNNAERRQIEEQIVLEATDLLKNSGSIRSDCGLVVAGKGWHVGTIGIVASRLCQAYNRPAAVISLDEDEVKARGSCRSIETVNIVGILEHCSELLENFGGHKMAGGFVLDKAKVDAFAGKFKGLCREQMGGVPSGPTVVVDAWVAPGGIGRPFLAAVEKLKPFGPGNPAPVWGMRDARIMGKPRIVKEKHLKMTLACGGSQYDAIAFGMGNAEVPDGPLEILFQLHLNSYQGRESLELNIKDFRPAVKNKEA